MQDLVHVPHMPIIKYVFRRSGSVVGGGTSPVKTSCRASLLNIGAAFPFNDFLPPYFSRSVLILAMWLRFSHAFSMFLGQNLAIHQNLMTASKIELMKLINMIPDD